MNYEKSLKPSERPPMQFKRPSQQTQATQQAAMGTCVRGCAPATLKDDRGHVWCQGCISRYHFMMWGIANGFPDIEFAPRAICADAEIYWINSLLASDVFIAAALVAMAYLDTLRLGTIDDFH